MAASGLEPWTDRTVFRSGKPERRASGAAAFRERGRRRTRQDQISLGLSPVKLRTARIRTERRKLVSSAGPAFRRANSPGNTIQPFDLMSRRHPLSATRATGWNLLLGSKSF